QTDEHFSAGGSAAVLSAPPGRPGPPGRAPVVFVVRGRPAAPDPRPGPARTAPPNRRRNIPMAARLEPGSPAPDFSLPDARGGTVSLADHRGRRVVVYFYPKASTPGCTTQACDFRDSLE